MDDTGFTSAPERYTAQGRETIDRIRDELGDEGFRAFCRGNAMKYEDRAGAKGDPEGDAEKARWYRQMVDHMDGKAEDPRSGREGFVPYSRPASGEVEVEVLDNVKRNCWTCAQDERGCPESWSDGVSGWIEAHCHEDVNGIMMPRRDADGCPGWTPKQ